MSDRIIPVTVWLSPETHRAFAQRGARTRTDVSQVLTRLAEKAIVTRPEARVKGRWTRVMPEHIERARELAQAGLSQRAIARELDLSQSAIANHWHRIIDGTSR